MMAWGLSMFNETYISEKFVLCSELSHHKGATHKSSIKRRLVRPVAFGCLSDAKKIARPLCTSDSNRV